MLLAGTMLFALYAGAAALAYAAFGQSTGILALFAVGSVLLVGFQYKFGKWAALRSVGAEEMPEDGRYAEIHRAVESLSRDMGVEKPRLMVAEMGVPNAFAVGRKGAGVVVVSQEIIDLLERDELEGVLAHELAHISNRDVVMMLLGQSVASLVGIVVQYVVIFSGRNRGLANLFAGIIAGTVAQFLTMIVVFAISRYREYVADADAARFTGNPDAMARALEKISQGAQTQRQAQAQTQSRAAGGRRGRGRGRGGNDEGLPDDVAALCIFNDDRGLLERVFSTHPPVEKRIERLRSR